MKTPVQPGALEWMLFSVTVLASPRLKTRCSNEDDEDIWASSSAVLVTHEPLLVASQDDPST
jgi:hypothetical protein